MCEGTASCPCQVPWLPILVHLCTPARVGVIRTSGHSDSISLRAGGCGPWEGPAHPGPPLPRVPPELVGWGPGTVGFPFTSSSLAKARARGRVVPAASPSRASPEPAQLQASLATACRPPARGPALQGSCGGGRRGSACSHGSLCAMPVIETICVLSLITHFCAEDS